MILETRIKCILFDIGNILVKFDQKKSAANLSHFTDLKLEEIQTKTFGAQGESIGPVDLAALGAFGRKKFVKILRRRLKISKRSGFSNVALKTAYLDSMEMAPEIERLLHFLAERRLCDYVLGLVSNISALEWEYMQARFPVFSEKNGIFPVKVLSYEEKSLKPAGIIFTRALERAQEIYRRRYPGGELLPEECLFLDNLEENVCGAARLGMRTILATDCGSIIEGLVRHGVGVPPPNYRFPQFR